MELTEQDTRVGDPLRELRDAVVRLLKVRPFYGYLLLGIRRKEMEGDFPLGVTVENGTPTLAVNPGRFSLFSPEEQKGLLEHVVKHLLHLHMLRRKERHSHDWDIACDLAVNPGIEHLPPQAATPSKLGLPHDLSAEEYYDLLRRPFDTGNLEGQGYGNATRDAGEYGSEGGEALTPARAESVTADDHRLWDDAGGTPLRLAEEAVRSLVREAVRQSDGEVPGDVRLLVERWLVSPRTPWRQVLRQFVATAGRVGRQSTWKREHRRFSHATPGMRKRRRLNLLIGIDVSDSTDVLPLREAFARELVQIARGRDSRLTVLYSGSRIQRIETFRSSEAVAEVFVGGGFTDFRPVFEYARTMQPPPAAVIYLTDGIGPAPQAMEFPTLWVLTKEGKKPAPWGVELRLEGCDA